MSGDGFNDDSPAAIRSALSRLGMSLKKRWGQNFLINRGAREKLVALLEVGAGMKVWEIGPGFGAMTESLLAIEGLGGLTVFEVDRKAIDFLEERIGARAGFRIVAGDALRTWTEEARRSGIPDRILGNLPYASASAILASLLEAEAVPARGVFTVQRELAERMVAGPGDASYSSFSVLCRSACLIGRHGDLRPGSFYPAPEVVSTIVSLRPRPASEAPADRRLFRALVRGLFAGRRKTLRAMIASGRVLPGVEPALLLAACERAGLRLQARPGEYDVADYARLTEALRGELPRGP